VSGVAIIVLCMVNVALAVGYAARFWGRGLWLLPVTPILALGFLNYPLRALVLLLWRDANILGLDMFDVAVALVYYTVFVSVLVAVFTACVRVPQTAPAVWSAKRCGSGRGLVFLVVVFAAGWLYRYGSGKQVYGLYESLSDLEMTPDVALAVTVGVLRWLIIPFAWLMYRHTGARRWAVLFWLVCIMTVVDALVSTGKGLVSNLMVLFLAGYAYTGRRVPRSAVACMFGIGVAFAGYSYVARYYGTVRGEFSMEQLQTSLEATQERNGEGLEMGLAGLSDRLNYLDGLVLASRHQNADPTYAAGSLVELAMLVPRVVWSDRPFLSFNHYVTRAVWGYSEFSEAPIGRVGESYYVLGAAGIIYAVSYGSVFAWLVRAMLQHGGGVLRRALYMYVSMVYMVPDAYLTYGIKALVLVGPIVLIARALEATGTKIAATRFLPLSAGG
jgi:hypothetical protein